MLNVVRLSCPTCGGRLEIKPGMTRLACGYCGNEHVVHRDGGTITLEAVGENLVKIVGSTERTAMELTLTRLEKELAQLRSEQSAGASKIKTLEHEIASTRGTIDLGGWDKVLLATIIGGALIMIIVGDTSLVGLVGLGSASAVLALRLADSYRRNQRYITTILEPQLESADSSLEQLAETIAKKEQEYRAITAKLDAASYS
jgi:hypothetical protein